MSSAVHSLQAAIVEGKQSLTQLLRQTKLIAAKLNLNDVEKWVDLELNGYPRDVDPPKYRSFTTTSVVVHDPFHGWQFGGNFRTTSPCRWPIADLEAKAGIENLSCPLPDVQVEDCFGEPTNLARRAVLNGAHLRSVLEAVKNELLQWTIELEKRGIKGENMSFDEKEKQSAASQVFNIGTVHGTVGNITNSQVTLYDYSSVQQLLIDHKIPKQARRELEDIMDELKEAPPEKKPSLLKRGEDWIVKHKDALGATAEAVGRAIGAAMKH